MNSCRFLISLFVLAFGAATSLCAQVCELMPIALHIDAIRNATPGALLTNVLHGAGSGTFGWLTWAGSPSTPTLIASLTLPGNSAAFVNPDSPSDRQLSTGDWVRGSPGVSNARGVRDALDALKGVAVVVPVWDVARGHGGNTAYRVSGFARIRLVSYQLPGQNRITAEYLGPAPCGVSNLPPVVVTTGDQTITLPNAAMLGAVVTDDGLPAGGTLTVSWAQHGGPAGAVAAIDDRHNTNTLVRFTEPGTYTFSITAHDSQLSSSNSIVVTVNRPNTAPVALGESFSNREDSALEITLQGYDAEGSKLLFAVTAVPGHGTLSGVAPNVRYTPLPDYHGPDSFSFAVSDGALVSAPATVTITNQPVNDPPGAAPVDSSTLEDTAVTIEFSGADVDADPITFEVLALPQHGALDITATNATYTPFTNYHGPDSFTYIARDASTYSTPALVSIAVASVNDPPAVDVGPDRLVSLPVNFLAVTSAVADVEFSPGELRFAWSSVENNGVTFDDASAPVTRATFGSNGIFVLRLTVADLLATNSDEMVVTVNAPPTVDAGADQWITLPDAALLAGQVADDAFPTNHLAAAWHAEGPGPVLFADAAQPQTTATFSESGWHTLSLVADDGAARATNSLRVLVNRAPVVDAGSMQVITNLVTTMTASVHDDGYPSNALVTVWEHVSGPGPAQFASNAPGTSVTFPTNGTYVLRLRADDGAAERTGEVTVHVNFPPRVDAGADRTIPFAQTTLLGASVVDDGVPPGTGLQVTWTVVSGPGTVALGDPGAAQTEAGFSQPGTYVLRLTAADTQWTISDDVVVTVLPPNAAPTVAVPPCVIVNYPAAAALIANVTDDGLPEGGMIAVEWSRDSGPGNVTFSAANELETIALFDAPGVYVLALTASDGELAGAAHLIAIVNEAPRVQAGPDHITSLSNAPMLHGTVNDDALPFGVTNAVWSKVSGPGPVYFISPAAAETAVRFAVPGEYVLRLTATDSNAVSSDEVFVSVRPDGANLPPLVNAGSNQAVALTDSVWLAGSVTDDGLPYGVPLASAWSKVSGPGAVQFSDSNAPSSEAFFSQSGTYVLRLQATDTEFTSTQHVTVSIYLDNQPPAVDAGPDQEAVRGPVTLAGLVFDDGFPTNHALALLWERISGPGTVTVRETNAASTIVTFSEPGVHLFRLTAFDGEWSASDDVVLTITGNQPPTVHAGPDQVVDLIAPASGSSVTTYPVSPDGWRYQAGRPGLTGLYGNFCCVAGVGRKGLSWSGHDLVVGGGFMDANALQVRSLARWDGCSYWPVYDPSPRDPSNPGSLPVGFVSGSARIVPVAARGDEIFATAGFFDVDLNKDGSQDWLLRWNGGKWETWQPRLVNAALSPGQILVTEDAVFVGGNFRFQPGTNGIMASTLLPDVPVSFNLTKWDGTNWIALGEGLRGLNSGLERNTPNTGWVRAVAVGPDGTIFAGGRFIVPTIAGLATNLARWDGTNWLPFGSIGGCAGCTADVLALAVAANGDLYAGGDFTRAGGLAVNRIARYDGTNWFTLGAGLNSTVEEIVLRDARVFAGGSFTASGTVGIQRVAVWDGLSWAGLSNGVNGIVLGMANTPSGVYVGGEFTTAGGAPAGAIAKWGQPDRATVQGPEPVTALSDNGADAIVPVILEVARPCGGSVVVVWNADGGVAEQTNVVTIENGEPIAAGFTNAYSPGVHSLVVTIEDGASGAITFRTTVSVISPAMVMLNGMVRDDGLPSDGNLRARWEVASGPSMVSFGDTNAASTTASFTELGSYVLRLVGDDSDLAASDDVTVTVRAAGTINLPPTVLAGAGQSIHIEEAATLNGLAFDDGLIAIEPVVTWSLVSGPGNASFSSPASALTEVRFDAGGSYVLRFSANDLEFTSFDDLTVEVSGLTNNAPIVDAGPDQSGTASSTIALEGTVRDDGLVFGTLNSWWSLESGPGTASFRVQNGATFAFFSEPGEYVLRLNATDGRLTAHDETTVTVYEQSHLPFVEISSLAEGASVFGPVSVTGTVSSAILERWTLEHRLKRAGPSPGASNLSDWAAAATGTGNVTAAGLGVFDPTILPNGIHELRLSAIDRAGRTGRTEPIAVVVEGGMKVGHFTLSFNDLTIPLAGIPIQVIRTYDSRDTTPGDFGAGWRLQLGNVRLQKTRHLGRAWIQTASAGLFPIYSVESATPRLVTVTFPDNTVHRFRAVPEPFAQAALPLIYPRMRYLPLDGTHASLTPVLFNWRSGARAVDDQMAWGGDVPGIADFVSWELLLDPPPGEADAILYNPDLFELRTREGFVYLISETNGLRSMADPNGNTVLVTPGGLTWSNAANSATLSVRFERDAAGRITNIVDALGQKLNYRYDAHGNLVSFTDRAGNTNGFAYSARHQLLAFHDALGHPIWSNAFDSAGRLVAQRDADGHTIGSLHDLEHRVNYETNRLGHVTTREYDERGNVVRQVSPGGAVSTFAYDARGNLIASSNATCACVTSFEYDSDDNLIVERDAAGHTKRYTRNERGQVLVFTDPEGVPTTNRYGPNGNLLAVIDAKGVTTSFACTRQGLVAAMTNSMGGVTTFAYNEFGHLTNEVDELGHATAYTVDAQGALLSIERRRRVRIEEAKAVRSRPAQFKSHVEREPLISDQEFYFTNTVVRFVHDPNGRLRATLLPENIYGILRFEQEYNANGQPIVSTGPNGQTLTSYFPNGKVASITHPDGSTESFAYDPEGHLIGHTTPRGLTRFEWAPDGQLVEVHYPDGSSVRAEYDAGGRLVRETDQNGCSYRYEYDAAGNRVGVIDPLGERTAFAFNARRTCTNVVDALGRATTLEFDYLNRHTAITFPDGTSHRATYLGRLVQSVTDEAGRVSHRDYDEAGRLVSVIDAAGQETRFQYDEAGNVIAALEPGGRLTIHDYDSRNQRIRTLSPDGGVAQFERDPAGRLLRMTDAAGAVTQLGYDSGGRVTSVIAPEGIVTALGYDAKGDLASVQRAGDTTAFVTDAMGRRVRTTFPDGSFEENVFDAAGLLKSHRDRAGGSTVYEYDCAARPSSVVNPAGQQTLFEYDKAGRRVAGTFAGRRTEYSYDARDRVSEVLHFDGARERFNHDALGRLASVTDAGGRTLNYTYDSADRVIGVTGPEGFNRAFSYNAAGFLASVSDALSGATTFTHDAQGNVTRTLFPGGTSTSATFDKAGGRTSFTDARGYTTGFGYDEAGRLVSVTDALGHKTKYSYDNAGRLAAVVDALERRTEFTYDITRRRRTTTWPDGATAVDVFDPRGLLLSRTDEEGRTTAYEYDALGQLRGVIDALGGETRYDYDALGRIASQSDALGRVRRVEYDDTARIVTRTFPGGLTERFSLDALGNVLARTDFNGATTTYEYDAQRRLTGIVPDARFTGAPRISFAYDSLGRRTSMSDGIGATTYEYDERSRLLRKATPNGTLTYTRDANGNVTSVASGNPNGAGAAYEYDALDRLAAVTDARLGRTTYSYDAVGNMESVAMANGLSCVYEYDARGRIRSLQHGALASFEYGFDRAGNRVSATEQFSFSPAGFNRLYAYDALDRLTTESISDGAVTALLDYSYDAVGNRLSRTSTLAAIPGAIDAFDGNDRPLRDAFDANGNTVTSTNGPAVAIDEYDFENRLARRTVTAATQASGFSFLYDGDGHRVVKTAGGITTRYLVDELNPTGWPQVIEELTSVNGGEAAVTRACTWGLGLIGQDQWDGSAWQPRWVGADAPGHVRFLADGAGEVTDRFDYDAFGIVTARAGTTEFSHLYRGEQFDADLGMYYLRARYYNPERGRFWTRDSFDGFPGEPQSHHRYAYAHNNPVNRIDPGGHYSVNELALVSGLAPDVRGMLDQLWSGANSFTHGLGGGEILKARNHASGLFVQGLVPETGVYLGRRNFLNTSQGAPFLLSHNPYTYIPEFDCFSCEKIGFGAYSAFFASASRHPVFQFDVQSSPLYGTWQNIAAFTENAAVGAALAPLFVLAAPAAGGVVAGLGGSAALATLAAGTMNVGLLGWGSFNAGQVIWEQGTGTDFHTGIMLSDQDLALRRSGLYGSVAGGGLTARFSQPAGRGASSLVESSLTAARVAARDTGLRALESAQTLARRVYSRGTEFIPGNRNCLTLNGNAGLGLAGLNSLAEQGALNTVALPQGGRMVQAQPIVGSSPLAPVVNQSPRVPNFDGIRNIAWKSAEGPIIIGETMTRVEAAAKKYPGAKILNDMPDFQSMGMNPDQVTSAMMQYNRRWILEQMRSGREIIDIGRDVNRTTPSIFYEMEQNMLRNYQMIHREFNNVTRP